MTVILAFPMEISMAHGNFQVLEISMAVILAFPMEISMAHGKFHGRPYFTLDGQCMAALVSTASALHFMVKLTFPFLWRVCLEKAFLLLARDNVLVLHILH